MYEELAELYSEWGYMDPDTFNDWADKYAELDGQRWVLREGTLLDATVLFGQDDLDIPTLVVIPEGINEWTSTYKARAWKRDETPDFVYEMLDYCSDNGGYEENADEYYEYMTEILDELVAEY